MTSFAFVFPGQGSQSVGMLDAWGDHPVVLETLKEASDALGEDVAQLIHEGPKEALAMTTNTQPVMLVSAVAAYRAWLAEGGAKPSVVAGHSLGEYSALVASGVLTLAQAAPLVRLRAAAMQEAVPVGVGAMAAILGLPSDKVIAGCQEALAAFPAGSGEVVQAANFNDPAQTVIAGSKAAVDKACEVLKSMGAKRALILPVSAPFHSSLMKPAAEKLREKLATVALAVPQIPGAEQHRCGGRNRCRPGPRRAVPPSLWPGTLGRVRASHEGPWREHPGRVWPRQSAGGHDQAHRRRIERRGLVRPRLLG